VFRSKGALIAYDPAFDAADVALLEHHGCVVMGAAEAQEV
jgi:hypothetical protein